MFVSVAVTLAACLRSHFFSSFNTLMESRWHICSTIDIVESFFQLDAGSQRRKQCGETRVEIVHRFIFEIFHRFIFQVKLVFSVYVLFLFRHNIYISMSLLQKVQKIIFIYFMNSANPRVTVFSRISQFLKVPLFLWQ